MFLVVPGCSWRDQQTPAEGRQGQHCLRGHRQALLIYLFWTDKESNKKKMMSMNTRGSVERAYTNTGFLPSFNDHPLC